MNQLGITPLDSLLNFTQLHLLVLTPQLKLHGLYPNHRSFLGWDESDLESFQFEENFLKPNQLDLPSFLAHFQQKTHLIKSFYWRRADQNISGPFETYFRLKKHENHLQMIMAFVKVQDHLNKIEILPEQKHQLFIAQPLAGLLHNLFDPLSTVAGRLEVLRSKNSEIKELDEILKMTYHLQSTLKSLGEKLNREQYPYPVEIDLNLFLRDELQYLLFDPFFKHQVKRMIKYVKDAKKYKGSYASLSGILSEFYYFIRRFVIEDQEYQLQAEVFREDEKSGFYLNFLGDFRVPSDLDLRFPFEIEGFASQIAQQKIPGLDVPFLVYCLRKNAGYLEIAGKKEMMKMRLLLTHNHK